jgi:large subunit ribosomal protein L6
MNKFKEEKRIGGRIGNKPIDVPEKIKVSINDNKIDLTSDLGSVSLNKSSFIDVHYEENKLILKLNDESKKHNLAMYGTFRQLLNNYILGLTQYFESILQVNGVGYTCEDTGEYLKLFVGFSHFLFIPKKTNLKYEVINKNTFSIKGIDKQMVFNEAGSIRELKKPNAYDGKGIIYKDEKLILKPKKK